MQTQLSRELPAIGLARLAVPTAAPRLSDAWGVPLDPSKTFATFDWPSDLTVRFRIETARYRRGRATLLLVGPAGSGKTHLLHALGNQEREANPRARILFLTSGSDLDHEAFLQADLVLIDGAQALPDGDLLSRRMAAGKRTVIAARADQELAARGIAFDAGTRVTLPQRSFGAFWRQASVRGRLFTTVGDRALRTFGAEGGNQTRRARQRRKNHDGHNQNDRGFEPFTIFASHRDSSVTASSV